MKHKAYRTREENEVGEVSNQSVEEFDNIAALFEAANKENYFQIILNFPNGEMLRLRKHYWPGERIGQFTTKWIFE